MGVKPSNNYQSNRPESGGADRDGERENNGLLERDKEKYASDMEKKRQGAIEEQPGKGKTGAGETGAATKGSASAAPAKSAAPATSAKK